MYAKMFEQIFDSSIADDVDLRHFFMDMIVLADSDGVVDMTPGAISGRTRIPLEKVRAHLEALEKPDVESRTVEFEGRRIKRLDEHRTWGWVILNYDKFRNITSLDQKKAKTRDRVRKHRARTKTVSDGIVTLCNAPVTPCNAGNATQTQTQTQSKKQKQTKKKPSPSAADSASQKESGEDGKPKVWAEWIDANRKVKRADPLALGQNTAAAKQLGILIPDESERRRIFDAYLADTDNWIAQQGYALCHLPKRIEAYRNKAVPKKEPWHPETMEEAQRRIEKQHCTNPEYKITPEERAQLAAKRAANGSVPI